MLAKVGSQLIEKDGEIQERIKFNGVFRPRVTKDELKKRDDYQPWMDILSAKEIRAIGALPYAEYAYCNPILVKKGLIQMFGQCHDWWIKLGALFPPSGQLKNFLNAALVANRVPEGGRLAIIGSRYSVGSGDWVELLARWLSERKKRKVTICCYDPNETYRHVQIGTVHVIAQPRLVTLHEVSAFDGIVDDVYLPGVGYTFQKYEHDNISQKVYDVAHDKVSGQTVRFLHQTEARRFSFPREWEGVGGCKCQRCQIETYLDIASYADLCDPSPCRVIRPEIVSAAVMWHSYVEGKEVSTATRLMQRASMVVKREENARPVQMKVQNIIGYGANETPFRQEKMTPAPIVVTRQGTIVEAVAVLVSPILNPGWLKKTEIDEFVVQERPSRRFLPRGPSSIIWGGIYVERAVHILPADLGRKDQVQGAITVDQWCFYHRRVDMCGLRTAELKYEECACGHRHGEWNLRPWGVLCGKKQMTTHGDFRAFLQFAESHNSVQIDRSVFYSGIPVSKEKIDIRLLSPLEYEERGQKLYWYGFPAIHEILRRGTMSFTELDKWEKGKAIPQLPRSADYWQGRAPIRLRKETFCVNLL